LNGTVSLEYAHSYYKTLGGSEISGNFRGKDISITPGAFFKLSPRIMFTGNLGGFSIYNSRYALGTSLSSFGGELNLGVRIKLFGKKK
jgi:hypothetical protein